MKITRTATYKGAYANQDFTVELDSSELNIKVSGENVFNVAEAMLKTLDQILMTEIGRRMTEINPIDLAAQKLMGAPITPFLKAGNYTEIEGIMDQVQEAMTRRQNLVFSMQLSIIEEDIGCRYYVKISGEDENNGL